MGDAFAPWHIIILLVVFVVLFGARKLPDSARSLGQAMRIFKAETKGIRHDDDNKDALTTPQATYSAPAPPAQQPVQQAGPTDNTQQQIHDLQRQLQDLQRKPAGDGSTMTSAPPAEAQPGQQTY